MKQLLIIFFAITAFANAQYTKLLDFNVTNGHEPQGDLILDGTFLYGMTSSGGTNNDGVIFKIMPDGTGYVDMLDFAGTSNGHQLYVFPLILAVVVIVLLPV